jgi:choline-phosphate cytidylyltransferase
VTRVITFGTFDILHVGHLNILERARSEGNWLAVGVSTDALNLTKKERPPVYSFIERKRLVGALKCVDEVFAEESLQQKREYILRYRADVLVMGEDWRGRFDEYSDICRVVYLPRTPLISTTATIERIRQT